MKRAKLKQYWLAICLLVSLFISAVSACTCSHYPKRIETTAADTSSCHQHSEKAADADTSVKTEQGQSDNTILEGETVRSVVPNDECCCIQPARKVVAKTENLKIEKQTLAGLPASQVAVTFVPQTISVKTEFITPFYLTDSFYNLTPGRAPPIF